MPDSKNKFVVQRPDGSWCIVETDGEHPDKGGIVSSEQDISAEEAKQLMSGGGTVTSPVIIRGYSGTTPGDGNLGRTNGSGALVTTNMPSLTYTTAALTTGAWTILESMNITGAPSGPLVTEGADGSVKGCVINNSSTNAAAIGLTTGGLRATVFDNDITLSGGAGGTAAISAPNSPRLIANRVKGGSADCIQIITSGVPLIEGNIIFRGVNGIKTFVTSITPFILHNTIANCSADGINFITGVSAANAIWAAYNRLDRNTSGNTNLATDWLAATSYGHDTTSVLQAAEYLAAASDDYRLATGAPGIGTGWMPYLDIGAVQQQATSSVTNIFKRGAGVSGRSLAKAIRGRRR
jgi:hypothetical protein